MMKLFLFYLGLLAGYIAAVFVDRQPAKNNKSTNNWMVWATITDLNKREAELLRDELGTILDFDYSRQNYVLTVEDCDA